MNLQKQKVWKSKKYLRFVASLKCCVFLCQINRDTVVPHHVEGAGRRKRDDLTIPICLCHHTVYHDIHRKRFEDTYGLSVDDLIKQTQAKWLALGNTKEWR